MPDEATSVADGAFAGCSHLTAIVVGENNSAFASAGGMLLSKDLEKLVYAPAGIGASAMVPADVRAIAAGAFAECAALKSIVAPGAVEDIAKGAFPATVIADASVALAPGDDYDARKAVWERAGFSRFSEPAAPGEVAKPSDNESGFAYRLMDDFTLAVSWEGEDDPEADLVLPTSAELDGVEYRVSAVAANGFQGRTGLSSVQIRAPIATIGDGAFDGCTGLSVVGLPDGLDYIGSRAFAGTSLSSATLPASVQTVGTEAFANCATLSRIVSLTASVDVAPDALSGCTDVSVYTPWNDQDDYPWNVGLVASGNHVLPYGIFLPAEPMSLEEGRSADLFEDGVKQVPEGCELTYSYAATPISVEDGRVTGKKAGTSEVTAVLTLDGTELARATRTVGIASSVRGFSGAMHGERPLPAARAVTSTTCTVFFNEQIDPNARPTDISVEVGALVPKPSDPVRDGYAFGGWFKEASCQNEWDFYTDKVSSTSTLILYAKWTPASSVVAFSANGGVGDVRSINATFGVPARLFGGNEYSRDGYRLLGWSRESAAATPDYGPYAFASDLPKVDGAVVYLYAVWIQVFTVTFESNGGSYVSPQTIDKGSSVSKPEDPTRVGYSFAGWASNSNLSIPYDFSSPVTADIKIYARWTALNYTISYELNGGAQVANPPTSYTIKDTVTLPVNPTRAGYKFSGWYDNKGFDGNAFAKIPTGSTGNKTFYANWTPVSYTVNFNGNGGGSTISINATYDKEISTPGTRFFWREGYTLLGWSYNPYPWGAASVNYLPDVSAKNFKTGSGSTVTDGSTIDLYAAWIPNYQVTFESNGGSSVSSQTVDENSKASKPDDPSRAGYTFGGWYSNSSLVDAYNFDTPVTRQLTLYARWTANAYKVSFDANGGSGGQTAQVSATYDAAMPAILATAPTKTGYTFAGWYDAKTGGTQYYTAAGASARAWNKAQTATLYARWTANTYKIHFNGSGATSGTMADLDMTYDVAKNLTANAFKKTGYVFAGWATSQGGITVAHTDGKSVSNLTTVSGGTVQLWAVWKAVEYTIAFDSNGGTGGNTASIKKTYGESKTLPANGFTRTGYAFAGWMKPGSDKVDFADKAALSVDLANTAGAVVTLSAKWTPRTDVKYQVKRWKQKLGGNAGTHNDTNYELVDTVDMTGTADATVTPERKTITGFSTPDAQSVRIEPNGSTVVNYYYTRNSYTLTFDSQGGSNAGSKSVAFEATTTAPSNPTRTGYDFGGWYTAESGGGAKWNFSTDTMPAQNKTLYAKWTAVEYKISYVLNDGTQAANPPTSYTVERETTLPTPSKTGYTFSGWYDNAAFSGSAVSKIAKNTTGDKKFYAKWTLIVSCTVPTSATVAINASGKVTADGAQSISSNTVVPVKVTGITCAELEGAKRLLPDATDRSKLLVTVKPKGKNAVSVGLGKSLAAASLGDFRVPANSTLPLEFGLTVPAGSKLAYLGEGSVANVAQLEYTVQAE